MSSYVINLERRTDRKINFINNYNKFGPNIKLNIFKAIDGTHEENVFNDSFYKYISLENDYGNNPRVSACTLSHLHVWDLIANGEDDYGLVFEDDIIFREDSKFKTLFSEIHEYLQVFIKNDTENSIIYFGAGDLLPIHVPMPSQSLLKAVEFSHVHKSTIKNKFFGKPRPSAYVFEWLGAFSYILPKKTAKYLFDQVLKEHVITKAVDVFLKDVFENRRYFTAPLLTYHGTYDLNIYDSDTWGISVPIENNDKKDDKNSDNKDDDKKQLSLTFVIPTYKRKESLQRTIENILECYDESSETPETFKIKFIIICNDDDTETLDYLNDNNNLNISYTISNDRSPNINKLYNLGLSDCYNCSDLIAIWNDRTIIETFDWLDKIRKYWNILLENKNIPACLQLRKKDSWDFNNVILTNKFINIMKEIPCLNVLGYIKYISYLSKTNILVRDIYVENITSESDTEHINYYDIINNEFVDSPLVKDAIKNVINDIKNDVDYKACGIWINEPTNWKESNVLGTSELFVFNKKTI